MVYWHFGKWIIYACSIGDLYDSKSHSYREDRDEKTALILGNYKFIKIYKNILKMVDRQGKI